MSASLDKLMLTVGLLDRITGPMKGIQKTIQQVTSQSRKAFMNTAAGVTALIGASTSFANTITPANSVNNALKEVSSLDVADDTLKRLNQAGLKYSIQFGESAENFVRSAYDIKSGINELSEKDLPAFTNAAGVLAKATKANIGDITSYFGTMYNVFKQDIPKGKAGEWIEDLAGKTAAAVQMFRTTGPEMKAAFESLGEGPTGMGVSMTDQIAALGQLQNTMSSGSEAGTAFRSFINGVSGAGEKLGISFEDAKGNLLPIVDILKIINKQTNGMGSTQKNNFLSGMFGGDEAASAIVSLSGKVKELQGNINRLDAAKGMQKAIDMAKKMGDPWAQVAAGFEGIRIAIWQKALPSIEPFIDKITDASLVIVEWADKYPNLARVIGLVATGIMGLIAVAGLMTLAIGLAQYAAVGLTAKILIAKPVMFAWRVAILSVKVALIALRVATIITVIATALLSLGIFKLGAAFIGVLPKVWAFSAALLANPLTWVVLGIVALVAAIVGLVYYWDEVTGAISKGWNWLKSLFSDNAFLSAAFWPLYMSVQAVETTLTALAKIPQWWGDFQVWLGAMSIIPVWDLHMEMFDSIKQWWTDFKGWLSALDPFAFLGEKVDWLKDKLSWLPGIDTSTSSTQEVISKVESQAETVNKSVVLPGAESSQSGGESGGLFQTISNMFGGSKKSVHVEKLEVNNHGQGVRGDDLMYQLEMEAG